MLRRSARALMAMSTALLSCGGSVIQTVPIAFGDAKPTTIDGLTPCTERSREPGRLDPDEPLVVLVHGCNDSAARFTRLAEVFEVHGQQAVCFTYESRDTIEVGARRLGRAMAELEKRAPGQAITIIGHSQGGLVSRRALTRELGGAQLQAKYDLVTVSSPFGGIRLARHCSLRWLMGLSLGLTAGICLGVAGKNWHEIHRASPLVAEPGELRPEVDGYLQIQTDERGSCLAYRADGACKREDFVFSLSEQSNRNAAGGASFRTKRVVAGHREIVGEGGVSPLQLIETLQAEGIMNPTPPGEERALAALLRVLYAPDSDLELARESVRADAPG